ncbi:MAG: T9SS type A sorting domain-containing protein [Dysgonomonas sp.]
MKQILLLLLVVMSSSLAAQNNEVVVYVKGNSATGECMYVGNQTSAPSLFIKGSIQIENNGQILQNGTTVLTGNFTNNATDGKVFVSGSTGTVEFAGQTFGLQTIGGTANRALNYINFPNVKVNNSNGVMLSATMGMSVNNLNLSKGCFILDSKVKDAKLVNNAHLLPQSVTYNRTPADDAEKGMVQVKLALGDNYDNGRIVGFTPPFKKIYSDYFFFNYLSAPTPAGLFGDDGALITSPQYAMTGGRGYLVGQGVVKDADYYWEQLDEQWKDGPKGDADYNKRAKEEFSFNRYFAEPTFTQFVNESDAYNAEELNINDISVSLQKGWNYLGNPFSAPLDLSSWVDETTTADEWGVSRGAKSSTGADVKAVFYVLTGGEGEYNESLPKNERFTYNVSYLLGQKVGSTLQLGEMTVNDLLIAPMQMFVIQTYTAGNGKTIKIPASKRTQGDVQFYRARSTGSSINDEFLIEVNDLATQGFDRLTVVFRDNATTMANDPYDATKIFNYSKGVSQIYTMSSDDKKLTANVIAPTTESIEMGMLPTSEQQLVSLKVYRLSSLKSVSYVYLEDKITGAMTDLLKSPQYTFMSTPTDRQDRFTLHFVPQSPNGIDNNQPNTEIYTSYSSGILYISGLNDSDDTSVINIYDLQGRIVYSGRVTQTPKMEIPINFSAGTYIIKIKGNRNHVNKVLAR